MQRDFRPVLSNIHRFSVAGGIHIRGYQSPAVDAIIDSVIHHKGMSFVIMFPRQTGKNEIQGQIENYLLFLFSRIGGSIIKISPTWKPQSINAKQRLKRIMTENEITRSFWKPAEGYQFLMDRAKISFLSGEKNSNIVGATADILLEVDEAQDVDITKYDREIAPMAASTNATRAFFGTAWTSDTLLARERRLCEALQKQDGIQRVFRLTADDIFPEVPAYRSFVGEQIIKLGRNHPTIKTQYYSEEIDAESQFIKDAEILMAGDHERLSEPEDGVIYVILIDVAGGEEENKAGIKLETDETEKRDATAVTICEINLDTLSTIKHAPTWLVRCRYNWTGFPYAEQCALIEGLINKWRPAAVCCDGTGIGAGMAAFIRPLVGDDHFINFVFSLHSKSKIGWAWLAMVQTGRWREYRDSDELQRCFFEQIQFCRYEVVPGPGNLIKFAVPDGTRNGRGEYVHDDLIMSAAMSAAIEEKIGENWIAPADTLVVPAADPLAEMRRKW